MKHMILIRPRGGGKRIAALLVLAILAGCQQTPTNRWATARVTLNTVQNSLVAANVNGWVDDNTLVAADLIVQSARAALNQAEFDLPDGGDVFNTLIAGVNQAIVQLQQMYADAVADQRGGAT